MGSDDGVSREFVGDAARHTARAAHSAAGGLLQKQRDVGWPSPASRVANALDKKGVYVPVRLKEELNDALLAISIEAGARLPEQNDERITLSYKQDEKRFSAFISIPNRITGMVGRSAIEAGGLEKILPSSVEESIRSRGLQDRVTLRHEQFHDDYIVRIQSPHLDDLMKIIADDFINKNYPEYAVDYKKILREESPGVQASKGRG